MKKIGKIFTKNLNKLANSSYLLFKSISQVTSELHKKWYSDRLIKSVIEIIENIKSQSPFLWENTEITLPKRLAKYCNLSITDPNYLIENEFIYEGDFFMINHPSNKASKKNKIRMSIPLISIKVIDGVVKIRSPYDLFIEPENPINVVESLTEYGYIVLPESGLITEISGNDLRSMMNGFIERRNALRQDLENLKTEIIDERKKINSSILAAIEAGIASAKTAGAIKIQTNQNSVMSFVDRSGLSSKYLNDLWDRLIYDPTQTAIFGIGSPSAINCTAGIEALRQAVEQKLFERLAQTRCDQITDQIITDLGKTIAEEMARSDRFANWTDCD